MMITRRRLIVSGAAASATVGAAAVLVNKRNNRTAVTAESNNFFRSLPMPEFLNARNLGNNIELVAQTGMTEVVPHYLTPTYGYSSTILGPVIQVQRGDTVNMKITNALDKATTVHWHGLFVPSELDGGPYNGIEPGKLWQPSLHINQAASTAWFHPHPHVDTGHQVYKGLAGLIYIKDESSDSLELPTRYGLDDFPLILQDKFFNVEGDMVYDVSPMSILHGLRGNTLVVNGMYGPVAAVPRGIVRLRLLNGANARNFRLAFDDGRPMNVIANDNGFIANSVPVWELTIAPGERYEVLVDFSNGKVATLLTYADQNGRPSTALSDRVGEIMNDITDILTPMMRFDPVDDISAVIYRIPTKLVDLPSPKVADNTKHRSFILDSMIALNMPIAVQTKSMATMDHSKTAEPLEREGKSGLAMGMKMGINGRTFDLSRIDAEVKLGDQEIWELSGTEMAHPFHIHGASFRILNLDGAVPPEHQTGAKDTVLVNEWAQLLVSFDQLAGPSKPFMFHCHILEHEDVGMMGQYVTV